jgi:hypothetical protein
MGILGRSQNIESPVQQHQVSIANDVQWISGEFKSLGIPHYYINQDNLDTFILQHAHISPWSFTGLPNSHSAQAVVLRKNIQFLTFPDPETMAEFKEPLRTSTIILQLPLAIVRGDAPFLSEASLDNFLDFYKGLFIPMCRVNIHYLTDCAIRLPADIEVLYVNRDYILSYIGG